MAGPLLGEYRDKSPHKGQQYSVLIFYFMLVWTNGNIYSQISTNMGHYDVTMTSL